MVVCVALVRPVALDAPVIETYGGLCGPCAACGLRRPVIETYGGLCGPCAACGLRRPCY